MEAAAALNAKVKKLAMYEAPYNDDPNARKGWMEYRRKLNELVAAGRAGDAVGHFMMLVGLPPDQLEGMHHHPMWPLWEAVGLTLAYDAAAMGEDSSIPTRRAAKIGAPTLVMTGSETFPCMLQRLRWPKLFPMHSTVLWKVRPMKSTQRRSLLY
jgi:hypothetical protein